MYLKKVLLFCACLALLTSTAGSHEEVYLIRWFYEVTPGMPVRELRIGHGTYDVLADGWQAGDTYTLPAPEKDGYIFLSALSDSLTGTFGEEDVYLTLYYTKEKFGQRQNKKPYAETMQTEYRAG